MLRDEDVVLVMSEETYEEFVKDIYGRATEKLDPIQYISDVSELDIVNDENLPYGDINVYDKSVYYGINGDEGFNPS